VDKYGLTLCQWISLCVKIVKKIENVIMSGGGDNPFEGFCGIFFPLSPTLYHQ
jgi:hypothetical protein